MVSLFLAALLGGALALDPACFTTDENLLCAVCSTAVYRVAMTPSDAKKCGSETARPDAASIAARTAMAAGTIQGWHWLDAGGPETNASQCVEHLFKYMPRRDILSLFSSGYTGLEFILSSVRLALQARAIVPAAQNVSWGNFLDYVLPYNVLDEKIDLSFGWRARFYQAFAPLLSESQNVTDAMYVLAGAVPELMSLGALAQAVPEAGSDLVLPGPPFTWKSETAPAFMSVEQVARFGGSCTGTAIVLVKAARSVGLPVRIAGCSESIVAGDDHHWVEFYDPANPGPFGDGWHTREGVSTGNKNGPWDAPSAPMGGCLEGVLPRAQMRSLWASKWSSDTFLPSLWHNTTQDAFWGFVGGENRCGAYCQAWGCGPNRTKSYTQAQCGP